MKKLSAILAAAICFTALLMPARAESGGINVLINGRAVAFTEETGYPYVDENHRTMVPLRVTMEAAGAAVGYDAAKQTAIVITERRRIEVPIGTNILYSNNTKIQNDTNAVAKDGRTYLPIRAVLEAAGYTVEWNGETNSVVAYNFTYNENELVPYSTSSLSTLADNILNGNVVCINGRYYATPDYVKMLTNTQVIYAGDDLNTAIYPQASRYDLADAAYTDVQKEWVSESDLDGRDIIFQVLKLGGKTRKGFYSSGYSSSVLYEMPSLPDDFISAPYAGTFDGVQIKLENGELLFNQEDLLSHGILEEPITERTAVTNP